MDYQNLDNATKEYLLRLSLNNQLRELQNQYQQQQQQQSQINTVTPPSSLLRNVLTLEDMQRALSGVPQVVSTSIQNYQPGISSSEQQIVQGNVVSHASTSSPIHQTERILSGVLPGSGNAAFTGQGGLEIERQLAQTKEASLQNHLLQAQVPQALLTLLQSDEARKLSESERYLLLTQILGAPQTTATEGGGVKVNSVIQDAHPKIPASHPLAHISPSVETKLAVRHSAKLPETSPLLGPSKAVSSKYNLIDLSQIGTALKTTRQESTKGNQIKRGDLPKQQHQQQQLRKKDFVRQNKDSNPEEWNSFKDNLSVRRSSRKQKEVKRYGTLRDEQAYFCGRATLKYKDDAGTKELKQDKKTLQEKELFLSFMHAAGIDKDATYFRSTGINTNATEYVAFEISLGDLCFLSCLVSNVEFHTGESLLDQCKNLFDWFHSTKAGLSQLQSFSGFSSLLSLSDSAKELLTRTPRHHASRSLADHLKRDGRFSHVFHSSSAEDGSVQKKAYYYLSSQGISPYRYFIQKNDLGKDRGKSESTKASVKAKKGRLLSSIAGEKWKQVKAKVSLSSKVAVQQEKAEPTTKGLKKRKEREVLEKTDPVARKRKGSLPRSPRVVLAPQSGLQAPGRSSRRSSGDAVDCRSRTSPLVGLHLTSIINSDTFYGMFSQEERNSLMKLLPEIDKGLLMSCEKKVDKKGSSKPFFANCQFLSGMTHYQDLLRDGLLEESSNRVWIPSKVARAKRTSHTDKPKFFIPQLGEIIYGENIPNKILGLTEEIN